MTEWILVFVMASYKGGAVVTVERWPTERACILVGNAVAANTKGLDSYYRWNFSCTEVPKS